MTAKTVTPGKKPAKKGTKTKKRSPRQKKPTAGEGVAILVAEAKRRQQEGAPIPHHLARALREAWLQDQADHIWPDLGTAAAETGHSESYMRRLRKEGAPLPTGPIPKAPLLRWLWDRTTERLTAIEADDEDVDKAWRRARTAKLTGEVIAEAEDRAQQGVLEAMNRLRQVLLSGTGPGQIYELVRTHLEDRMQAEECIQDWIESQLRHAVEIEEDPHA